MKKQGRDIKDHSGCSISYWQSFQQEKVGENEGEENNSDNSKFKSVKGKHYYLEWMCPGSEVLDTAADFQN